MKGRISAIVPAAGVSRRMGLGYSKAYADILGIPLLARTLMALLRCPLIDAVWTAVHPGEEDLCRREIVEKYGLADAVTVIPGGLERQHTVAKLLRNTPPERDLVLVHDGARPFVKPGLIMDVLAAAERSGAAIAALAVSDTVKFSEDKGKTSSATLDRAKVFLAQTPQAFVRSAFLAAHRKAKNTGFSGTDDASLMEWNGHQIHFVKGDPMNIKVTTADDLGLCRWILEQANG